MPNFIICGTPGTGKSSIVKEIRQNLEEFNFINLSQFALDQECILEFDDKLQSHIIDEDKLVDKLEPELRDKKLNLIECIHPDMVPSELVDLVFVCRTDITLLYDRLKGRNYSEEKITNNTQAEIFQNILDEARSMFNENSESMIVELFNNHPDDLVTNAKLVVGKIRECMNVVSRGSGRATPRLR